MSTPSSGRLPTAETLLQAAVRAVRSGNRPAARSIVRAVTRQYPNDVRGWMGLTDLTDSAPERIMALERIVVLAPENERAKQALARLRQATAPIAAQTVVEVATSEESNAPTVTVYAPDQPTLAHTTALREANATTVTDETPIVPAPAYEPDARPTPVEHAQRQRVSWLWPLIAGLLLLIAVAACLVLLVPSWFGNPGSLSSAQPSAEATAASQPTQAGAFIPLASATIGIPATTAGGTQATTAPAEQPRPTLATAATRAPTVSAPTATRSSIPRSATNTPLPAGTLLELDNWRISLARPDRLLLLDSAVGDVQPKGEFVLALVSLANMSGQPRRLPPDLFALIDDRTQIAHPVPALSTIYLATYGRGLRGDLSLEDEIPAGGGYFSVPVLFDVAHGAQGLRLSLGDGSVGGWELPPQP